MGGVLIRTHYLIENLIVLKLLGSTQQSSLIVLYIIMILCAQF